MGAPSTHLDYGGGPFLRPTASHSLFIKVSFHYSCQRDPFKTQDIDCLLLKTLQRGQTSLFHNPQGLAGSVAACPAHSCLHKLISFSLTPCSFHPSNACLLAVLQTCQHFRLKAFTLAVPSDSTVLSPDFRRAHSPPPSCKWVLQHMTLSTQPHKPLLVCFSSQAFLALLSRE